MSSNQNKILFSFQGAVLASSSVDGTLILWDLSNGQKMHTIYQENGEAIRSCCFSPNGEFIASADDSGTACIWSQNKSLIKYNIFTNFININQMNLRILRYHEETVYTVAFSPDSRVLLSACNMGSLRFMIVDNENASESKFHRNKHLGSLLAWELIALFPFPPFFLLHNSQV